MKLKSKTYLKWVSEKPCLICGAVEGVSPHHLPDVYSRYTRRYKDFDNVIGLCYQDHMLMHRDPRMEEGYMEFFREKAKELTKEYAKTNGSCLLNKRTEKHAGTDPKKRRSPLKKAPRGSKLEV